MPEIQPYVPAEKNLPELTFQAIFLGLVLSLIMCAANIYVGLFAGMTVSAAIPASVISMGVLRGILKRGTILENNVVHTIASSGESLAAGIIFTVPAIVLLGLWDTFNYWETTLIAAAGGVMGVVMMIPLRRPMIIEQEELRYPEGVACAEVLKAGDRGGAEMMGIFSALGIGFVFKLLQECVGLFKLSVEAATGVSKTGVYFGMNVSPMLMAVGFIVGWEVSLLIFLGGAISYLGAIPLLAWGGDFGGVSMIDALGNIWDTKIRFFGIGAMVVGGVYSIFKISGSMGTAIRTAARGIRGHEDETNVPRTEQGISGKLLFSLLAASLLMSGGVYYMMTGSLVTTVITAVLLFILAFFFVAVAAYIVGLVGSSNSPVSGMTICTVLITAGLLLMLGYTGAGGMLATLGVAGVVCCAACTSGDICQDLKIGQIVGATPKRLQIGELFGTIVPAFIIAPVMMLMHKAFGIGEAVREGVKPLAAPQGVMFEKLVGGIFGHGDAVPWNLVGWGALVGVLAIAIDLIFLAPKGSSFRLHAMPLAVGMYLPWTVTTPILLGGLVYLMVNRKLKQNQASEEESQQSIHRGLLFSSGLVAGEAIAAIAVAGLLVADLKLPILGDWLQQGLIVDLVSLAGLGAVIWLLMRKSLRPATE